MCGVNAAELVCRQNDGRLYLRCRDEQLLIKTLGHE
eukprot:COSAG01_NODE_5221_length_4404_cov_2.044599_1_plen_35_part_10